MFCIKCNKEIPEGSLYCNFCGKKQNTEKRKTTKRCNGGGSITKLPRKNKPWWVRLTKNGKRISLGCFQTKLEATEAIEQFGKKHTVETVEDIYNCFIESNYFKGLSTSGKNSHKNAWKHLSPISSQKMENITTEAFQGIIDNMNAKRETTAKVRNLASLLCKEAMRRGIINTNYGSLVQLKAADTEAGRSFTEEERKKIWDAWKNGNETAGYVSLLIYTGMRPNEPRKLEIGKNIFDGYFITGSKTDKGMDRIIPYPDFLQEVIDYFISERTEGFLFNLPAYSNWRRRCFVPLMEELGITGVVPNSGRHTYSDIQKRRNIDPEIMMDIMGHEDYSTTVERYHSLTAEDILRICSATKNMKI